MNFKSLILSVAICLPLFQMNTYSQKPWKIGVCAGIEKTGIVKQSGADYLESSVRHFLVPTQPDSVFEENLRISKQSGIEIYSCNLFVPNEMKSTGPDAVPDKILEYATVAFQRAQMVGIRVIVFGSGGSRKVPDGFSHDEAKKQLADIFRRMAPVAQKYGVMVAIEQLNKSETNFVNSLADAAEIAQLVDHPNFGIVADFYHMMRENDTPAEIIKYSKYLKHCHIAEKDKRTPPGVAGDDFLPFFEALETIQYQGRISIEANWENFDQQLPGVIKFLSVAIGK